MLTLATERRITRREIAKELGLGDRLILAPAWRHAAML